MWSADIERLPDPACARDAIASIEFVSKVEPWNGSLGIYLKPEKYTEVQVREVNANTGALMRAHDQKDYTVPPTISVTLSQRDEKPWFRMTYMGWRNPGDRTEIVARAVISQIAARCNLPSLAERAVEKQATTATPYLFGI